GSYISWELREPDGTIDGQGTFASGDQFATASPNDPSRLDVLDIWQKSDPPGSGSSGGSGQGPPTSQSATTRAVTLPVIPTTVVFGPQFDKNGQPFPLSLGYDANTGPLPWLMVPKGKQNFFRA